MTSPRSEKSLSATVVRFQRDSVGDVLGFSKERVWETGIAILPYAGTSDVTLIVDLDGKPVEAIYDYRLVQWQGCFTASDVDEFVFD